MIFTFWEGTMPPYIELCMRTWKEPYILLTYDNLNEYTNVDVGKLKNRFTLPVIADVVRVHVLRDNGGYWLDADTIWLGNELPVENMAGDSKLRTNTIGFLHANHPHEDMFEKWALYQDKILDSNSKSTLWSLMGNSFTDEYIKLHKNISLYSTDLTWAETYMVNKNISRYDKYQQFYFKDEYSLKDLKETKLLMLHNSWTPLWYKQLSTEGVLDCSCTLSNVLREVLS